MQINVEHCRQKIRADLHATVGHGTGTTVEEAAKLAGISGRAIYQLRSLTPMDEQYKYPERHLFILLRIPAFAARYMASEGYTVEYTAGQEEGCPYVSSQAVLGTVPVIGEALHNGNISAQERRRLRDCFIPLVRKLTAFLRRESNLSVARAVK